MQDSHFVLRNADEACDLAFIMASWLQSYFRTSNYTKDVSEPIYYAEHRKVVETILSRPETRVEVACNPDDNKQIYGYAVTEAHHALRIVHYVFVKRLFRDFGIAKALLPFCSEPCLVSHLTVTGKHILPKAWQYSPYLF